MQLVKISLILSIISPLLVHAGPIAADDALIKRDKDICPRDRTAQEGDPCNKRSGDKAPHICAKNRPRVIVSCLFFPRIFGERNMLMMDDFR